MGDKWFMEPVKWGYAHLFKGDSDTAVCGQQKSYLTSISPVVVEPMVATDKPINLCYDCVYPPEERREEYKRRCSIIFAQQTGGGR